MIEEPFEDSDLFIDPLPAPVHAVTVKYNIYETKPIRFNLGMAKWYSPFRRYCFFPKAEVVLSPITLDRIKNVLKGLDIERKKDYDRRMKNRSKRRKEREKCQNSGKPKQGTDSSKAPCPGSPTP